MPVISLAARMLGMRVLITRKRLAGLWSARRGCRRSSQWWRGGGGGDDDRSIEAPSIMGRHGNRACGWSSSSLARCVLLHSGY